MSFDGRLGRSLSAPETWSFGVVVILFWAYSAQPALVALGPLSLLVWGAVAGVGSIVNLQVAPLARAAPALVGGTPSYASRLWADRPWLGRYMAMAYYQGWASVPPVAALFIVGIIGTDLPRLPAELRVGLVIALSLLPFVIAASGIRTIAVLQLLYVVPTVVLLGAFIVFGLDWIVLSPASPGLVPVGGASPGLDDLAKWAFVIAYSAIGFETTAMFTAESGDRRATIRSLAVLAVLAVPTYAGASYVLLQATPGGPAHGSEQGLVAAAARFWGPAAPFLTALFLVAVALLSGTTAAAAGPRVLYQQARDGRLAPVFGVASALGVPGPALVLTAMIGLCFAVTGSVADTLIASTAGWVTFWMLFHVGLWRARRRPEVRWPWLALGLGIGEGLVLAFGGIGWGIGPVVVGLLIPVALLLVDAAVARSSVAILGPQWWIGRYGPRPMGRSEGNVTLQVGTIVALVMIAVGASWILARSELEAEGDPVLLATLLLVTGFVGVAVAGGVTFPRLAATAAARERAELAAQELRVEQEAQRAANRELERVNRAQRDFVSIVSHEFRTPLTGIQGFAEIIRDEELAPGEVKEFADDIHRDAVRLARMINEILDLERMRSGRMRLNRQPVDLAALIARVAERAAAGAPDHPLDLRLEAVPSIDGDPDKLVQVVTNLLSNAVKYSPFGGPVRVSLAVGHGGIELAVGDRGVGIPADQLDTVFDPYTRVENGDTKNVQGTGLGLPIVREIVRLHGGRVWAEAGAEGGTVFRVRLPVPGTSDVVTEGPLAAAAS